MHIVGAGGSCRVDFHHHVIAGRHIAEEVVPVGIGVGLADLHSVGRITISIRIGPKLDRDEVRSRIGIGRVTITISIITHLAGDIGKHWFVAEISGEMLNVRGERCYSGDVRRRDRAVFVITAVEAGWRSWYRDLVSRRRQASEAVVADGIDDAVQIHIARSIASQLEGDEGTVGIKKFDSQSADPAFTGILHCVAIEIVPDIVANRCSGVFLDQIVLDFAIRRLAGIGKGGEGRCRLEHAES